MKMPPPIFGKMHLPPHEVDFLLKLRLIIGHILGIFSTFQADNKCDFERFLLFFGFEKVPNIEAQYELKIEYFHVFQG